MAITKILFRRGTNSQRQTVALQLGEPGYAIDSKRLYVGDGVTAGGIPAGIINYGIINALSGSYIYNATQTNMTSAAFGILSAANVGDIVYDQSRTSIWTLTSVSNVGGTFLPVLSNLAILYSTTNFNANQFYYDGTQLTIKNGQNGQGYGVGINELNSSITAGSPTLSGGSGSILGIKPGAIGNTYITPGTNSSVKITDNTGAVTDITIGPGQLLGQTNAIDGTLKAVSLIATNGLTLSANRDTIVLDTPVCLPKSGGALTGTVSALNSFNGRFVSNITPISPYDVVNLDYIASNFNCITPAVLSNYLPLTGGNLTGTLTTSSYLQARRGILSTDAYNGGYVDGIVMDYVEGNGRISVGTDDAITLYNGGVASTALVTVSGGRVGIGTTTPVTQLHINSSNYGAIQLGNNVNGQGFTISKETDNSFNVWTNVFGSGTNRLKIDQSGNITAAVNGGNVGIGTSSPAYKLDVVNIPIAVSQSGTVRFGGGTDQYSARIETATDSGGVPIVRVKAPKDGNGYLTITSGSSDTERLRILANGNVGIGTTTPAYTLDINGTSRASRAYADNTPTAVNELTRKDYVDTQVNNATPAGTVAYFAGTTPPAGWIKANGAVLSKASYTNLYNAIGLTWWLEGDGPTNFRLPDLRGVFVRGWNDNISNGNTTNTSTRPVIPTYDAGRAFGTTQTDAFGSHTHGINDPGHSHKYNSKSSTAKQSGNSTQCWTGDSTQYTVDSTTGITINAAGGAETRPVNVALLACIKY